MTSDKSPTTREACWAQALALLAERESFERTALDAPAQSARRALQSMEAVGLVERDRDSKSGSAVEWRRGEAWEWVVRPLAGYDLVWDAEAECLRLSPHPAPSEQSTLEDAS